MPSIADDGEIGVGRTEPTWGRFRQGKTCMHTACSSKPIANVLKRYAVLTGTFVLNEILALDGGRRLAFR